MVFIDYLKVDVPQTNANNAIVYTTSFLCMAFFVPIGSRMEDDAPVGLFVDDYFIDTDSGRADFYLYYSRAVGNAQLPLNAPGSDHPWGSNVPAIIPSGKNIRAFIANSSDRIGGTLHIFRLPE